MLSELNKYILVNPARERAVEEKGFTLVEMMIALVLTFIVTTGLYRTYVSFQVTFDSMDQLVEMQQSLRIGMNRLVSDLKMAGYDPRGIGDAGIKNDAHATSDNTRIQFKMDFDGGQFDGVDNDADGETDEPDESVFGDGDYIDDDEHLLYFVDEDTGGRSTLYRQECSLSGGGVFTCKTKEPIISYVEKLNFVYLKADGTKIINFADTQTVQVALIVRTANEDYSFTDNEIYKNLFGDTILPAQHDNFHRRLLTATVKLRN